jgi:hypothetical protein
MTLLNFIKKQPVDFVDTYKNYFEKTFGAAITFTLVCFVIAALLFRYSDFDDSIKERQISLLSYFFHRYSKGQTYSIIDLTKTVFVFFISLFSLGLLRISNTDKAPARLSFKYFLRSVKFKDILLLSTILILSSLTDFILFRIDSYSAANTKNQNADVYIHDLCFHLRIYLPLIFFALAIRFLNGLNRTRPTLKALLLLYIGLWLFNEFAYEVSTWVRSHLFGLILMPFDNPESYYLIESLIGIPLFAFYFLGYFSAMTTPLKLTEQEL